MRPMATSRGHSRNPSLEVVLGHGGSREKAVCDVWGVGDREIQPIKLISPKWKFKPNDRFNHGVKPKERWNRVQSDPGRRLVGAASIPKPTTSTSR